MLRTERDIVQLIESDDDMMRILHQVQTLHLPDWWVCAGFVRNKIWDVLHGFTQRTPLNDVDVIYFDPERLDETMEKQWEQQLHELDASIPWSVTNEARMHVLNDIPPYTSSVDAMSKFPETATAIGVSLDVQGRLILCAPWGIADVLAMQVRPTPFFASDATRMITYNERFVKKQWSRIWHQVERMNHSL